MESALAVHNTLIRQLILVYRGWEVKTEGDAFMIAFGETANAVRFCLATQIQLIQAPWPDKLLALEDCSVVRSHVTPTNLIFRGFRVRMGIHTGARAMLLACGCLSVARLPGGPCAVVNSPGGVFDDSV